MIKENKTGLIVGVLYGLISPMIAALGLVSQIGGLLGLIFALPGSLIILLGRSIPGIITPGSSSFLITFMTVINVIFYAYIGMRIQKRFGKKRYVIFFFGGILALLYLIIFIEAAIRRSLGLHVGP